MRRRRRRRRRGGSYATSNRTVAALTMPCQDNKRMPSLGRIKAWRTGYHGNGTTPPHYVRTSWLRRKWDPPAGAAGFAVSPPSKHNHAKYYQLYAVDGPLSKEMKSQVEWMVKKAGRKKPNHCDFN